MPIFILLVWYRLSVFSTMSTPSLINIQRQAWPKITSVADVTNDPALLFSDEAIQQIGQVKTPLSEYVTKYAEKGVPLWDGLTVGVPMNVDVSHGPGYRLEAYASAPLRCRSPRVKVLHCLTVKEQEARRKGVAARRGLRHRSAR